MLHRILKSVKEKFVSHSVSQCNIRSLKEADLVSIRQILYFWFVDFQLSIHNKSYLSLVQEYFKVIKQSLQNDECHYFVATHKNTVVGIFGYTSKMTSEVKELYVQLKSKPLDSVVQARLLFVHHKYLRRGIGELLFYYVLREAHTNKNKELLFTSTRKWDQTSWGFYDHLGLKHIYENEEGRVYYVNLENFF
ncbi:GNAT family N-acetyltransferase [Candidatus Roizmanbacteria bacterium]|nr:GNAT family N-acetyltransferase [Candidatus Roizmanbacteria bacterium]